MKKIFQVLFYLLTFCLLFANPVSVHASEKEESGEEKQDVLTKLEEEMSLDEIDSFLNQQDSFNWGGTLTFEDLVTDLLTTGTLTRTDFIWSELKEALTAPWKTQKKVLLLSVGIACFSALFIDLSSAVNGKEPLRYGNYLSFLLLSAILFQSFHNLVQVASSFMEDLNNYMNALMPAYFVGITFSTGAAASTTFYETTLVLLRLVQFVTSKILFPAIELYFALSIVNYFSKDHFFQQTKEALEKGINWILKTLLTSIIGLQVLQGLFVPVFSYVKKSVVMKLAGAIPGVGDMVSGVAQTVLSAGVLIKNAVGVVGLIFLILLCVYPMCQVLCGVITYQLGAMIIEPLGEENMCQVMSETSKTAGMVLRTMGISALCFLCALVIMTASTCQGLD